MPNLAISAFLIFNLLLYSVAAMADTSVMEKTITDNTKEVIDKEKSFEEIALEEMAFEKNIHTPLLNGDLSHYEPNYFAIAYSPEKKEMDDDNHLEFYLSLKYKVTEDFSHLLKFIKLPGADRFSFIYNGLYDFYLQDGYYDSAPIISRRQNPGIVWDWDINNKNNHQFSLGWFHESNGQTLSVDKDKPVDKDENGVDDAIDEFWELANENSLEYALTQVSRGWDYADIRYQISRRNSTPELSNWWFFQVNLRLYCNCQAFGAIDREDDLFWLDKKQHVSISDFDGVRLTFEKGITPKTVGRIELKTGISEDGFFQHTGGKISLNMKMDRTWGTLFYFNGYGKEPSTYHLRTQYIGLGIEFR